MFINIFYEIILYNEEYFISLFGLSRRAVSKILSANR